MRKRPQLMFLAASALLYGGLSCSEDPARVGRPPVVEEFTPTNQALDVFTGDTLVFTIRAMDPDRAALSQRFLMGDSVVSVGTRWQYVVADTGDVTVSCVVTDGEYDSHVRWSMKRRLRINYPPVIHKFFPVERNPTMIIDTSLEFAVEATDDDRDILLYSFSVDGQQVSEEGHYVHIASESGAFVVEAAVSDGELISKRQWNLTVTGEPDTIPPAEVVILSVETGAEPGEVEIAWVAVGQDSMDGVASTYLVRTSPAPVVSEEDWIRASVHSNVPAPLSPGEPMAMTIVGMQPARFTHVAVRAVDSFGNLSPIGAAPGVYTRGMRISGLVRDAVTLAPLGGIEVKLAHFETTTDTDGTFDFIELPPIDETISAQDEPVLGSIGSYFDYVTSYEVVHEDTLSLYLLPNITLDTPYYDNLYLFYRTMTDLEGVPYKTSQHRWELPIDLYVPAFTNNGLDYRTTIVEVAAEFDAILGVQMFNVVESDPDLGVRIEYQSGPDADNYQVTEWSADFYPVKARIKFRTVYGTGSVEAFRVVARHELGHAIGLKHSGDNNHLMVGGTVPSVSTFTPDELAVIKALHHIPRGHQMLDHRQE